MSQLGGTDLAIIQFEFEETEFEYGRMSTAFPLIDTSVRVDKVAACLASSGVKTVIRYYCRDAKGSWKTLKKAEADALISARFSLAVVHEIGADYSLYSYASGKLDGAFSVRYGQQTIGQPKRSAVYFAVDFDADSATIKQRIIPYFQGVSDSVAKANSPYKIGVYGSGLTCSTLLESGLVSFTWLAQSTRWRGYKKFKDSNDWDLLQKPSTTLCTIGIDFDQAHEGKDFGAFATLDSLVAPTSQDEAWENVLALSALEGLDPDTKARVLVLVQECAKKGVKMVPAGGLRTPQTQSKLWRQSRSTQEVAAAVGQLRAQGASFLAKVLEEARTAKGPHVTNALPGISWHQWGEAVDCYWDVNGRPEWDPDASHGGIKGYHVYADLAESKQIGLTAGGHWSTFKDWPHVQRRKAPSPRSIYSVREIDRRMQDLFGERLDISAKAATGHSRSP